MNDKKNNGSNPQKPKVKKINGYSAYIYLALAICIVTALTIGILTMSYNYNDITSIPQVSIPDVSIPDVSVPDISEAPVGGEESDVDEVITDPEPVYVFPVDNGTIQKEFSMEALVFSSTMQDYRVHSGIDIAADLGSAVKSYTDGTIKEIVDDPFYGKTVVIEHAYGLTSYYKNLAAELPEGIIVGKIVKAGDIIGAIGASAINEAADPSHLHFELKLSGDLIDPKPELEGID
ncbi:MAG: hypothetical protein A2Y15_07175 [Clostridiales bacterium GWF2_36_10]|nr:MAG: hypothetical protein A2Y15_07175 [Clostridiales bacterium GWF2_36_10]HAN21333.1 hypothetical protein [Clostridiales bacterium]